MTDKKLDKILENKSNMMADIQYIKGFLKGNNARQNEELICDEELNEEGLELMKQLYKIEAEYIERLDEISIHIKALVKHFDSFHKSLDNVRESAKLFNNIDFTATQNNVLNTLNELTNQK